MASIREMILSADDRPKKAVPTPEWPVPEIWVKTLSAAQREEWEAFLGTRGQVRAALVVLAACDENGVAIFTKDDVSALAEKSTSAIIRIFDAAQSLNKITKEDVDELEGNSDASPSDSSVSD